MKTQIIILFSYILTTISCKDGKDELVGTWEFISSEGTCGDQKSGRTCKDDIPEVAFLCCPERKKLYDLKDTYLDITSDSFANIRLIHQNSKRLILHDTMYYNITDKSLNFIYFQTYRGKIYPSDTVKFAFQINNDTLILSYDDTTGIIKAIFKKIGNSSNDNPETKKVSSENDCNSIIGIWSQEGEFKNNNLRLLNISEIEGNLVFHEYFYNPARRKIDNLNEAKGAVLCENGKPILDFGFDNQEIHIIKNGNALLIGGYVYNRYNH